MINPLEAPSSLPFNAPAFDQIKLTHIVPAIKAHISQAQETIDHIKNNVEPPSFQNTIVALEQSSEALSFSSNVMNVYYLANMTDEMQAIYEESQQMISRFSNDMMADLELFKRIKHVYDQKETLNLSQEDRILLEETYKSFMRNGANLSPEDKKVLRDIDEKMITVTNKFNSNVTKDTNDYVHFVTDKEQLKGLSDHIIESMAALADDKGKKGQWAVTIQPSVYQDVLGYAQDRDLRKTVFMAKQDVARTGERNNFPHIKEILALKRQRTALLGYKDYPSYVLEKNILNTPKKVTDFLETLHHKVRPHYVRDLETLTQYAKEQDSLEKLEAWDIGYYRNKLKAEKFNYDPKEIQQYLPTDQVLQGFFDHCEKLFNIKFEKNYDLPKYHDDVEVFTVIDQKTDTPLGIVYGDFYYRDGKEPHAWAQGINSHHLKKDGSRQLPIITINQSTMKSSDPNKPTLMSLYDVETLFHEGGHGLHHLLSERPSYASLSGTKVKTDFVELPSQVQENWVMEKDVLQSFAKHHKTGEILPESLFDKIKKSSQFMYSHFLYQQNFFGQLDIAWYTQLTGDESIDDLAAFEKNLSDKFFNHGEKDYTSMSQSFSHIFTYGYDCSYYSYAYSEVLDADAFEAFKETGDLYHPETAQKLRELMNAGGTEDPMVLYKKFRGREPDPDAMLKRAGLI